MPVFRGRNDNAHPSLSTLLDSSEHYPNQGTRYFRTESTLLQTPWLRSCFCRQ